MKLASERAAQLAKHANENWTSIALTAKIVLPK